MRRCLIVKTQGYTWHDFTGQWHQPVPVDWLRETQMGLEELNAQEVRMLRRLSKRD